MELGKSSVLMMSAPALGAFLLGAVLLGGIVPNTTDKFSEELGATGYVTVSVFRGGQEIYHYEDHNLITEDGMDFIAAQVGGAGGSATAQWIALSSDVTAPSATDSSLTGEIVNNGTHTGLARSQGTFTQGTGADLDTWTIEETFIAGGSEGDFTGVRKAGLFTASSGGTMMAENTFSSVNLASGDELTITWRIDLGIL